MEVEDITLLPQVTDKVNTPEARAGRRRVWLRAVMGEFFCTFIFFVAVMGANLNFTWLSPNPTDKFSALVANALVAAFTAISIV